MEKIFKLIIGVIALVIIIVGLYFLFGKIYTELKSWFSKDEIIQGSKVYRESILENLENCANIDDYDCFCQVWPNFPASLPRGSIVKIENIDGKSNVSIYYGKYYIESKEINISLYGIRANDNSKIPIKNINFEKEYPTTEVDFLAYFLTSSFSLKFKDGLFFIFLPWPAGDFQKHEEKIKEKIKLMPKCEEKRQESADFFMKLVNILDEKTAPYDEISVNIGNEYYIKINNNKIGLYKNNEIVKMINKSSFKYEYPGYGKFKYDDWAYIQLEFEKESKILCGEKNEVVLKKDDKIKIIVKDKNGNKEACIEIKKQ